MSQKCSQMIDNEQLEANINTTIVYNFEVIDNNRQHHQLTPIQQEIVGFNNKIKKEFKLIEVESHYELKLLEASNMQKIYVMEEESNNYDDLAEIQQTKQFQSLEIHVEIQLDQNTIQNDHKNTLDQQLINISNKEQNIKPSQQNAYQSIKEIKQYQNNYEFSLDDIKENKKPLIEFNQFLKYLFLRQEYQNIKIPSIPKCFSSADEYIEVFKANFYNENYYYMINQLKQYEQTRYYSVQIKQDESLMDKDGIIFELNIQQQNNFQNTSENSQLQLIDFYNYKNYILIVSEDKNLYNLEKMIQQKQNQQIQNRFFGFFLESNTGKNKFKLLTFAKQQSCFKSQIIAYIFPFLKISTQIKEVTALQTIEKSSLCPIILVPKNIQNYNQIQQASDSLTKLFENLQNQFNISQIKAIKDLTLLEQGISLLQGPPGTGKTKTLVGLVSCIFKQIKLTNQINKNKILICAPSNQAIDTIINRILEKGLYDEIGFFKNINLLRIGAVKNDQANKTLIESSIEYKAEQLIFRDQKLQNYSLENWQIFKRSLTYKYLYNKQCDQLLERAEIICSTLGSCYSEILNKYADQFQILIIDEASQCTEPNCIIPLRLGINKLILIGDHKQLPATIFSHISAKSSYSRSLFERILDNGIKPFFLNIQYRMDPQISQFSSENFYNKQIIDDQTTKNRNTSQFNKKFLFLDLDGQEERVQTSFQNRRESFEITNLIRQIQQNFPIYSIGVICAYKAQVDLIKTELEEVYQNIDINVNTIDSFQGQECDIILLSCVRSNQNVSIGFLQDERRINVAITRARVALFIFGNQKALSQNEIWKQIIEQAKQKDLFICIESEQNIFNRLTSNNWNSRQYRNQNQIQGQNNEKNSSIKISNADKNFKQITVIND